MKFSMSRIVAFIVYGMALFSILVSMPSCGTYGKKIVEPPATYPSQNK